MSIEKVTMVETAKSGQTIISGIALLLSGLSLIFSIYLYGKLQSLSTVTKRSYLKNRGRVEKLEREVIYLHSVGSPQKRDRGDNE